MTEDNSLFEPLLDLLLDEEKQSYNNPLQPYERYRQELRKELAKTESEFTKRLKRAASLIKEYDERKKL